jgi:hypothetical protein
LKRLITEYTIWKIAATGFGIITGIAIVAFMNQLNFILNSAVLSGYNTAEEIMAGSGVLLSGKIISAMAGSFFCGAVIKLLYMNIGLKYIIAASIVMMFVALSDLLSAPYPVWFTLVSLGVYAPMAIIGSYFIENIRKDH